MFPPRRLNFCRLLVWGSGTPHPERMDMENGSSRFTLAKSWIAEYEFIFCTDDSEDHEHWDRQWLSQAPHHFKATNIPREDWSLYDLRWEPDQLNLRPITTTSNNVDARQFKVAQSEDDHIYSPYYLFILPLLPLSSAPDLESWRRAQTFYYWSVDPDGASVMSEEQRISIGLPSYTSEFLSLCKRWPAEVYDFMRLWQEAKGFDPTTTDFARSMGYPILEVLPQNGDDRFETVTDADEKGAAGEDMEVESFVDGTHNGSSSESCEPPTQAEMSVEMDTVLEDMEVDG
ncbi:hypothetical protein V5O48_016058 [Marasmius crinis-equi]|uniref:Uncharacterized protein n=1 Tax=Marasmius crinis-equi TaxID=585013 RepID=A0ABR3EST2_9AGAR